MAAELLSECGGDGRERKRAIIQRNVKRREKTAAPALLAQSRSFCPEERRRAEGAAARQLFSL